MFSRKYSTEPTENDPFTKRIDGAYTAFAGLYDVAVKRLPVWKTWINHALPHIQGERVLELSFGTGYLLTQYASRFNVVGLDFNQRMVEVAESNLRSIGIDAPLIRGDVCSLPFESGSFDCIVNTMAFSGYPDATGALSEMHRVLGPGGRLVLLDIAYPAANRPAGLFLTNLWKLSGDLIRDVGSLLDRARFEFEEEEIGGFGSVHLFIANKRVA